MKHKVLKIIIGILIITISMSLIMILYFLMTDIETKTPEHINNSYNLTTEKFCNRNIFIITSKQTNKSNYIEIKLEVWYNFSIKLSSKIRYNIRKWFMEIRYYD